MDSGLGDSRCTMTSTRMNMCIILPVHIEKAYSAGRGGCTPSGGEEEEKALISQGFQGSGRTGPEPVEPSMGARGAAAAANGQDDHAGWNAFPQRYQISPLLPGRKQSDDARDDDP